MLESLLDPKFLLQLAILAGTIVMSIWRTNLSIKNRISVLEADQTRLSDDIAKEIGRLADQVEKQNGYVRTHGEELAALRERLSVEESRTKRDREIAAEERKS